MAAVYQLLRFPRRKFTCCHPAPVNSPFVTFVGATLKSFEFRWLVALEDALVRIAFYIKIENLKARAAFSFNFHSARSMETAHASMSRSS